MRFHEQKVIDMKTQIEQSDETPKVAAKNSPPSKPAGKRKASFVPSTIRAWPVVQDGETRELLVRRDSVAWIIAGKGDLEGKTLIALRTAGAKAIPVDAAYAAVRDWWLRIPSQEIGGSRERH